MAKKKTPNNNAKRRSSAIDKRKARARSVLRQLKKLYPDANCALKHKNALQLLIATILSAQSTDANVNRVTPQLFRRYRNAKAFAKADLRALEEAVHSTGFFRQKAKNIQGTCRLLAENYNSSVPEKMEELITLPGVARKTANVVLGTFFGKNVGVVVDTHVGRISTRLDLTWTSKDTKDAVKIEKDLMEVLPRKDWTYFSHAVILHGRETCSARKPRCDDCTLARYCPSAGEIEV